MSIENIYKRISSEADKSVKEILDRANTEASGISKEYAGKAGELEARLKLYAGKKADEEEKRLIVSEQLELRKMILKKKREILGQLYDKAREKIEALPVDECRRILKDLILHKAVSGKEEIMVAALQKDIFTPEFLQVLNEEFGGEGGFTLAAESGDISWGVVLREGRRVVDLSLDVIFKQLKEKIEPRIAALLFTVEQ